MPKLSISDLKHQARKSAETVAIEGVVRVHGKDKEPFLLIDLRVFDQLLSKLHESAHQEVLPSKYYSLSQASRVNAGDEPAVFIQSSHLRWELVAMKIEASLKLMRQADVHTQAQLRPKILTPALQKCIQELAYQRRR